MDGLNYRFRKATLSHPAANQTARGPMTSALIALTVLTSSLALPLLLLASPHAVTISWIICVLCAVSLALLVRKTRVLILCAIVLLITISLTGSPVLPAFAFGTVISVGVGAAMLCASRGRKLLLPLILPVLSFAISYLATLNIMEAIASLVIYAPVIALAVSSRADLKKTTRIALCGGVMALIVVFSAGDLIYSFYGELTVASIAHAFDDLAETIVFLIEYYLNMLGNVEVTEALLREVRVAIDTFINLSLGLVCASSLIFAYLAQAIELCAFETFGHTHLVTEKATTMTASAVSAGVFVLAHVFSFTTDASANVSFVAIVATNLYTMLAPLFIYMGLTTALELPRRHGFAGILLSGIIVIAAFTIPSSFITILALVGAFAVIIAQVDRWAKEHYGKGENNE